MIKKTVIAIGLMLTVSALSAATGETLFGGATYVMPGIASARAVQLLADIGDADPNDDFSGIDFPIPPGLTFANMNKLSTDYIFTRGSCAGGSPRFQVNVLDPNTNTVKNIFVYIGPPPNYTGCPMNVVLNTGNLLLPTSLIDTSKLTLGTFFDPVATAVTKYGNYKVVGIQLVADTFGAAQTIIVDNVMINAATFDFEIVSGSLIYQLRYLANLDRGDSYINISNVGTLNGFAPAGNICVNIYTFDPAEELISCCACQITPNGLGTLSARSELISNTLTPGAPTSVTVKLVSSLPFPAPGGGTGIVCNASAPTAATLVRGARAWATTLHLNTSILPAPGVYQQTETPFSEAELSTSELMKLTSFCSFIQANGSGFGLCKACRFGALGGEQK